MTLGAVEVDGQAALQCVEGDDDGRRADAGAAGVPRGTLATKPTTMMNSLIIIVVLVDLGA